MTEITKNSVSRVNLLSWALYDWANSAFSAIIQTFVFAAYFTQQVAANETIGSIQWGLVNGLSGIIIAIAAPFFGAIADQGKKRKIWIIILTYISIIATCSLWIIKPNPAYTLPALLIVGLGIIGSELAFVFYNAMLPEIAPPNDIGKWSGWGWSFGYAGGVASLLLALFVFINGGSLINSNHYAASHIRATFPLVGIWYFVFSLPLFIFVPDTSGKGKNLKRAIKDGLKELIETFKHIQSYKHILRFLIARMFYIDGLTTLFAFGGVYAASLFGMREREILTFGIALNISSGIGAASFAWLDDRIGGKKLILFSLLGLLIPTACILFTTSAEAFWILGLSLGLFVGPVQSASRSYMARIAPKNLLNEMFGFFAFSGKATAFLGPLLIGWATYITNSQRIGISVILIFLVIGFLIMLTVPNLKIKK